MEDITLKEEGGFIKIYINKVLHLSLDWKQYSGLQAWVEGPGFYCIEIYLTDRTVVLNYVDFIRWKRILELLDTV